MNSVILFDFSKKKKNHPSILKQLAFFMKIKLSAATKMITNFIYFDPDDR